MSHDPIEAGEVQVKLESDLPSSLAPGTRTAIFCFGHCFARRGRVVSLELLVDGVAHRPTATRMPRRDLPNYRSGFWAVLPIEAPETGAVELAAQVRTSDGQDRACPLKEIPVEAPRAPAWTGPELRPETIVVALATFDPDPVLLETQLESLRAQSDDRWVCLVSDGGSDPDRYRVLLELIGGDPRFIVSRSERRLGPYQNFERVLSLVPGEAELVALCDQDDRWYPDKLATLRAALGSAQLVYSDQRLVDADGRVIRESLWQGRRNERRNLASLLVANAVPGAAALFRREVLDLALPFPPAPGIPYHDHWLALAALAAGELAFVDRPLFDWVQHGAAASRARPGPRPRAAWRGGYFGGYVQRQVLARTLLLRGEAQLTPCKRRALRWFAAADRSPLAFAWLALRPLRRLVGRDETLSGEVALAQGILWRWLVALSGRDASFPDPPHFEQPRLRRWRAGA